MKRILLTISLSLLLASCVFTNRSNSNSASEPQPVPHLRASIEGGCFLHITVADTQNYHIVAFTMNDLVTFSKRIKLFDTIYIQGEFEKSEGVDHYLKAYSIAQNKGNIKVDISVDGVKDTTLNMPILPYDRTLVMGTASPAARLHSSVKEENLESEIRKWAYRTLKNNVGDSTITNIATYSRALQRPDTFELIVDGPIPKYKNLSSVSFRVTSSLKSDHYYLMACQNDDDLDKMIEYYISNKFEGAANSISGSLKCHSLKDQEGLMCVFLVGINNDWSNTCIPCGAICIDRSSPKFESLTSIFGTTDSGATRSEYAGSISFDKRKIKISSDSIPDHSGHWYVDTGQFEGWSPYRVPYTISWSGDVEKISIYTGNGGKQTISVRDKRSPYHTTISTYLHMGDNYIKVEAVDQAGNISQNEVYVSIARIKDDTPQINNDINIWN